MDQDCLDHFSHDHPLTFFLNKEVDDDYGEEKPYRCSMCGLPILSSPSYSCSVDGCNFFLHKPCAELPEILKNPKHHSIVTYDPHIVYLEQKSPAPELCQNFTYQCDVCEFDMHPLLADQTMEIKSKHKSHKSHPLVAICRETSSPCDACGEKQSGFFFSCQECNFWIHQDCTVLPRILKLASHPHLFILTYSLSKTLLTLESPRCIFCGMPLPLYIGLYFCCECISAAHVNCARSNMENLQCETRLKLIQLPADEDEEIFPSLVIRKNIESNPMPDGKEPTIIEKYHFHKHPLKFHDMNDGFSSSINTGEEACDLVCDVCIQPVNISSSSPFYRCLDLDCHFLAHNICANLLPSFDFTFASGLSSEAFLSPDPCSRHIFNSIYPCFFCNRPCNGFCYYVKESDEEAVFIDVECMNAPNSINHASHGQHVLFRTIQPDKNIPLSCCNRGSLFHDVYRCVDCDDFYIHVRCALLPKRTRHRFDEHPLHLITAPSQLDNYFSFFCEFCEKDIDNKYWCYGCGECDQYFHVDCIPAVGYLSKVKFGKTLVDDNIHPQHPLALTRMLNIGRNERCGFCSEIIKGFVDEMAFHCSECDFWIHFHCARDSSCRSSTRLRLYSELLEEYIAEWS